MKKCIICLIGIFLSCLVLLGSDFDDLDQTETSTIKKQIPFTGTQKQLTVDNVFGKLKIIGIDGDSVRLNIKKTILGRTKADLKKARKEVTLDITSDENKLKLYVDGPFRDPCDGKHRRRKLDYIVRYDMEIEVPKKTELIAKTVTEGDIVIRNIVGSCKARHANGKIFIQQLNGDFNIRTANGKIEILEVSGAGKAHTANGKVHVTFLKNPKTDCSFKTVNGNVDIRFIDGLSGQFNLKTFHGRILSDFPFEYLPTKLAKGKRKNGKFIYKSNQMRSIKIGKGGPTISMDTLNGSLIIGKGV